MLCIYQTLNHICRSELIRDDIYVIWDDLDVPAGEKAYIKVKAPFCDKLSGMICAKFFSRDMVYTLRVKFQDYQGIVQFRNGSNETTQLRKDKAVGILDLSVINLGFWSYGLVIFINKRDKK